jgi:hypothetical protein
LPHFGIKGGGAGKTPKYGWKTPEDARLYRTGDVELVSVVGSETETPNEETIFLSNVLSSENLRRLTGDWEERDGLENDYPHEDLNDPDFGPEFDQSPYPTVLSYPEQVKAK